jgi:hypothetical protein
LQVTGRRPVGVDALRRVAVCICIAALAAVALIRLGLTTQDLARRAARPKPDAARRDTAGGQAAGTDVDFVEWARLALGPGDSYWIVSGSARRDPAFHQWVSYRLLPRRESPGAATAHALIWHLDPKAPTMSAPSWRVHTYGAGSAIAMRTGIQ